MLLSTLHDSGKLSSRDALSICAIGAGGVVEQKNFTHSELIILASKMLESIHDLCPESRGIASKLRSRG